MADYQAIAGVSKTLQNLLQDRMVTFGPDSFKVTFLPPDVIDPPKNQLNLYLFQIVENASLANQEIPGQGHPAAYGHPPLSLNLRYLLTAYVSDETADDADLGTQTILADAMQTLHDFPMVTDDMTLIRDDPPGTAGQPVLDPSLRGEFEKVKLTLDPMTMDDLSKLWSAMPNANFRRSVGYEVSVIQIETERRRRYPRLVGEPPTAAMVAAIAFQVPRIGQLRFRRSLPSGASEDTERRTPYARIRDTLIILGDGLYNENARLALGDVDVTGEISLSDQGRIELKIPDVDGLQPGAVPVKVVHDVTLADPSQKRPGAVSNVAVFMLVPWIKSLETNPPVPDAADAPLTLTVKGRRLFHESLESLVIVGDEVEYVTADNVTTETVSPGDVVQVVEITFADGLPQGEYSVRIRVNGAEALESKTLEIAGVP